MGLQNIKQILSFALFLFTSCSPIYYSPNTQNIPLISHKGEGNISFGAGNNFDPFRSVGMYELQGAYGLTDHVSLQVNSAFYKGKNIEKNGEGISGKGRLIETGLGYNWLLNRHFIFESYGIFSLGNFENLVVTEGNGQTLKQETLQANMIKYGIQPAIGFKSTYATISLSFRASILNYYHVKGNLLYGGIDQVELLNNQALNFLFEPALTCRAGTPELKVQLQIASSYNLINRDFRQSRALVSMGFFFSFNRDDFKLH